MSRVESPFISSLSSLKFNNYSITFPTRSDSTVEPKTEHVNGKLTLGENLADAGGIVRAWESWHIDMAKDEELKKAASTTPPLLKNRNPRLPGLDKYSKEQLFFMAFGQLWCSQSKDEREVKLLRTDPHSPAQFRVNGVAQNSVKFAESFKCPVGSAMNPERKCMVW